ncbi:MAG TPA: hypothetical protein VFC63_14505 [Blastocatellia bacterium]|nr:hypothetical protein [Blastocatellia bacterium]
MELNLDQNEASSLKRILTQYLSDLRMEVGGTESYDMRQSLKHDEELIRNLLSKLDSNER